MENARVIVQYHGQLSAKQKEAISDLMMTILETAITPEVNMSNIVALDGVGGDPSQMTIEGHRAKLP